MIRIYLSGNPVHDRVLKAFYKGCPLERELIRGFHYVPSDVAVVFGVYKSRVKASHARGNVIQQQRQNNLDVIVLETGYVNRGDGENHHYAAGWNGLNGRADFRNDKSPPERWNKLGVQLRPYSPGKNIVLCGQVPWDASVDNVKIEKWLKETAEAIKAVTDRPIVFRPHPLAQVDSLPGCEYHYGSPLEDDLKDAHAVVTFNSNSAVEAAIYGKPVFAADEGSMAWKIANKDWTALVDPVYFDRKQWAAELAYTQWTPDEFREGLAWHHLTR